MSSDVNWIWCSLLGDELWGQGKLERSLGDLDHRAIGPVHEMLMCAHSAHLGQDIVRGHNQLWKRKWSRVCTHSSLGPGKVCHKDCHIQLTEHGPDWMHAKAITNVGGIQLWQLSPGTWNTLSQQQQLPKKTLSHLNAFPNCITTLPRNYGGCMQD